jgi:hypothetical protein
MNKRVIFLSMIVLLLLAACGRRDDGDPTPAASPAPTIIPVGGQAAVIRHVDLLNSPSQYSGMLVRISGQFRRLPQLVCEGQVHQSPAGWKLTAGELFVQATGFEAMLRPLATSPQIITVEGLWQRWEGLVGCGADARLQEIWYLDVARLIDPNPIVFGTPAPGQPIAVITPIPEGGEEEAPQPPPPGDDEDENGEKEEDEDDIPSLPGINTATPTLPAMITATPTPASGAPPPGIGTATPGNGTPTVTATPTEAANGNGEATATPTATGTPNGDAPPPPPSNALPQGNLSWETVVKRKLDSGTAHSWEINVLQQDTVTVIVQPDGDMNISLTIERPDGSLAVNGQNSAGVGVAETAEFEAAQTGQYRVIVAAVSGGGNYAIVSLDSVAYAIEFAGNLRYGDNITDSIPEEVDQYWHFNAVAGDSVTIWVTPLTSSELFIGLFGPNGALIGNFASSATVGEPAALTNLLLPATGYYSLLIQEYFENPANYRIQITRN